MKKPRKIHLFLDGNYLSTTTRYATLKDAIKSVAGKRTLFVAGRGEVPIFGSLSAQFAEHSNPLDRDEQAKLFKKIKADVNRSKRYPVDEKRRVFLEGKATGMIFAARAHGPKDEKSVARAKALGERMIDRIYNASGRYENPLDPRTPERNVGEYMGKLIYRNGVNGMYSALGVGSADTLAGIKELIRAYVTRKNPMTPGMRKAHDEAFAHGVARGKVDTWILSSKNDVIDQLKEDIERHSPIDFGELVTNWEHSWEETEHFRHYVYEPLVELAKKYDPKNPIEAVFYDLIPSFWEGFHVGAHKRKPAINIYELARSLMPNSNPLKAGGRYAKFEHKRLKSPSKFDPRSFRNKKLPGGKELIIGCPKGQYQPTLDRCMVGTEAQALLKRKNPLADRQFYRGDGITVMSDGSRQAYSTYTYESRDKLYDVKIWPGLNGYVYQVNNRPVAEDVQYHRAITQHFGLSLAGMKNLYQA